MEYNSPNYHVHNIILITITESETQRILMLHDFQMSKGFCNWKDGTLSFRKY